MEANDDAGERTRLWSLDRSHAFRWMHVRHSRKSRRARVNPHVNLASRL